MSKENCKYSKNGICLDLSIDDDIVKCNGSNKDCYYKQLQQQKAENEENQKHYLDIGEYVTKLEQQLEVAEKALASLLDYEDNSCGDKYFEKYNPSVSCGDDGKPCPECEFSPTYIAKQALEQMQKVGE